MLNVFVVCWIFKTSGFITKSMEMYFTLKLCFIVVLNMVLMIKLATSITLRKECPDGEVHRSCAFYDEYTCWVHADRMDRVKSPPKRLPHCKAGCYCKRGLVREYPLGPCIVAAGCRNRKLQAVLKNLPTGRSYILSHNFQ